MLLIIVLLPKQVVILIFAKNMVEWFCRNVLNI